tara:strand:- start:512 stop:775 length:264 start_codon:yes stop_codon:yes gene_type:complete
MKKNLLNLLLILFIILITQIKYTESFVDKDLLYKAEPLLCDGLYFKIWLPFVNIIKFCIPGIYFPKHRRRNDNPGRRDCRGFAVCEI